MNPTMEARLNLMALGLDHLRDARPLSLIPAVDAAACGGCHPYSRRLNRQGHVIGDVRRLNLIQLPQVGVERPMWINRRRPARMSRALSKPGPY